MNYYLILTGISVLMLVGVAGSFIPVLPGLPFMFALALVYAIFDKFVHISATNIVFFAILAIISILIDYFSGFLMAKYSGASRNAQLIGFIGMILGLIVFPPLGGFIGLFAGILIGEYLFFRGHKQALKSASGGLFGSIAGSIVNLVLSIIFLVSFIIFALK